jgi:hypothetical protein
MEETQDSGKVWCKGFVRPIHALRIENKIFATGKSEDQTIEYWVDDSVLCVDLNEPEKKIRVAKKFPLDLDPTIPGTLFNGFTRTKHADVLIVTSEQDRVEEETVSGETYREGQYDSMDSKEFWDKVWG